MDGDARMMVVHYLNQFFAGLGAEEAAGHEPVQLRVRRVPAAPLLRPVSLPT